MPKYPNLDCMDVTDVEAYAFRPGNPPELREYASTKLLAMRARLRGDIATAMKWEAIADKQYDALPPEMKW